MPNLCLKLPKPVCRINIIAFKFPPSLNDRNAFLTRKECSEYSHNWLIVELSIQRLVLSIDGSHLCLGLFSLSRPSRLLKTDVERGSVACHEQSLIHLV